MQVIVHVPASLRQYAGGAGKLPLELGQASTVGEVFSRLHVQHPGIVERVMDESGQVRQHVNVFVDGDSIRAGPCLGLDTPVRAGTEVWILPAVSGG
jgi:molybdopterin synthase sulfur carrier subunit